MLFLHEVHQVRGASEADFEAAYRDELMPTLADGDDARLLWYCHQAHGSGFAYHVVTITAVRDGAAWERLSHRVTRGDLRAWVRQADELRHEVTAKLLMPVEWSPMQEVDFDSVPADARTHAPTMYMEDTGWPHVALDEYISFWERGYYTPMVERGSSLLQIDAVFQVAFGAGKRKEAILMQKILDHKVLTHLLTTEPAPQHRLPGQFMHEALSYRDQWESKLLRTSPWSPLF